MAKQGKVRKQGLAFKITLRVGLGVLVVFAAIIIGGVHLYKKTHEQDVLQSMQLTSRLAGEIVDRQISQYIKQVEDIAQRETIRSMDWDVQLPILKEEATRIGFERFQVEDTEGNVISTTGHKAFAGDREFFKQVISGISNISDVLFARIDLKMTIVVSAPIRNEQGVIVGALSGVTSAQALTDITSSVHLNYDGTCFVINKAGQKMAGVDYRDKEELDNDLEKEDASLAGLVEVERKMITGATGIDTYKQGKDSYYISYMPIQDGKWFIAVTQNKDQAMRVVNRMIYLCIGAALLFMLLILIGGYLIAKDLGPLSTVSERITEIASGKADLTQRIHLDTKDEIGDVVMGFNQFTEKLQSIMKEIQLSKDDLHEYGERLSKMVHENADFLTQMQGNIKDVDSEVGSQHLKVGGTVDAVDRISQAVESLRTLLQRQTDSVEQASTAVTQMIGNIESVSSSVEKMAGEFDLLQGNVGDGISRQHEVNAQIQQIEQQSKMLNEANIVISSIASQTNLLAMNAAIEAAHAGEAGQGFAVVADEIRKLSETSSGQSRNIRTQIKSILKSIATVVQSSDLSDKSFTEVMEKIQQTGSLVHQIKVSLEEQATGSKQINQTLSYMNEATSQVRGASEDVDRARQEIIGDVGGLKQSSDSVKVLVGEMEENVKHIEADDNSLLNVATSISGSIYRIGSQIDKFKV